MKKEPNKDNKDMKKHRKPCQCDVCEKARWEYPCRDGSHPSFWKTVVISPQWKAWRKEQQRRFNLLSKHQACNAGVYDMSEVEECGWISSEHFQEFSCFVEKNNTVIREAEICTNGKKVFNPLK